MALSIMKNAQETTTIAILLAAGIGVIGARGLARSSAVAGTTVSTAGANSPIVSNSAGSALVINPGSWAKPQVSDPEHGDEQAEQSGDREHPVSVKTTGDRSPIVWWSPGTTIITIEDTANHAWNSLIEWLRDLRLDSRGVQRALILESERFAAMQTEQVTHADIDQLIAKARLLSIRLALTQPDLVPILNTRLAQALHASGHHEAALTIAPAFPQELNDPDPDIETRLQNTLLDIRAGSHAALGQWQEARLAWGQIVPQHSLYVRARLALCHLNLHDNIQALQTLTGMSEGDEPERLLREAVGVMRNHPPDYIASLVWFGIGQASANMQAYALADEALLTSLSALEQQPTVRGWNRDLDRALILQELTNARFNLWQGQTDRAARWAELRPIRELADEARATLISVLSSGVSAPDALNNYILSCWTGISIAAHQGRHKEVLQYLADAAYAILAERIREADPTPLTLTVDEAARTLLGMRKDTSSFPSLRDGSLGVEMVKMSLLAALMSHDGDALAVLMTVVDEWDAAGLAANQQEGVSLFDYAQAVRQHATERGLVPASSDDR